MNNWTVEKIREFYTYLNEHYSLNVNPNIIEEEKNKFPLCRRAFNNLVFVPEFFNHELIELIRVQHNQRCFSYVDIIHIEVLRKSFSDSISLIFLFTVKEVRVDFSVAEETETFDIQKKFNSL